MFDLCRFNRLPVWFNPMYIRMIMRFDAPTRPTRMTWLNFGYIFTKQTFSQQTGNRLFACAALPSNEIRMRHAASFQTVCYNSRRERLNLSSRFPRLHTHCLLHTFHEFMFTN